MKSNNKSPLSNVENKNVTDSGPPSWKEIKGHIIAGAVAGSATSLITCPLDVVKTRMQYLPILKEHMKNGMNDGGQNGMLYTLTKLKESQNKSTPV